ncbi:MAG: hypothetical protein ACK4NC_03740 [Candidatus Gracilibacteria bacterium]
MQKYSYIYRSSHYVENIARIDDLIRDQLRISSYIDGEDGFDILTVPLDKKLQTEKEVKSYLIEKNINPKQLQVTHKTINRVASLGADETTLPQGNRQKYFRLSF